MRTPMGTGGGSEVTVGLWDSPPTLTIHCGPLVIVIEDSLRGAVVGRVVDVWFPASAG